MYDRTRLQLGRQVAMDMIFSKWWFLVCSIVLILILISSFMQLKVEALKFYDSTISNLELWKVSLKWFFRLLYLNAIHLGV
jgi:hypothetical protein